MSLQSSSTRAALRAVAGAVLAAMLLVSSAACVAQPKGSAAGGDPSSSPAGTSTPATASPSAVQSSASISWSVLANTKMPVVPHTLTESPILERSGSNATVKGWSGGYVDFVWEAVDRVLQAWHSADGVTWQKGGLLVAPPWSDNFRAYDAEGSNPADTHDSCMFAVTQFQEGPRSLLVSGHLLCMVGCASGSITEITTWTSTNGLDWTYLDPRRAFGGIAVGPISGGSTGFAALSLAKTPGLLLSSDARSWTKGKLPAEVLAPNSSPRDPVAFAGGYALPGVVPGVGLIMPEGISGCGASVAPDDVIPPSYQGAVWLSADGSTWSRSVLPGVVSDSYAEMRLIALDDRTLLAIEETSNADRSTSRRIAWTSRDGKTWTVVKGVSFDSLTVLHGGELGLAIVDGKLSYVDSTGQFGVLRQTGSVPNAGSTAADASVSAGTQMTIGPAGVLAYDGAGVWMGVVQGI